MNLKDLSWAYFCDPKATIERQKVHAFFFSSLKNDLQGSYFVFKYSDRIYISPIFLALIFAS